MSYPRCQCLVAGFCPRHGDKKTSHLHKLCKTREDYRKKWDIDAGYTGALGLGDKIAILVEPVRKFLRIRKCRGCKKRQKGLNKISGKQARSEA